MVKLSPIKAKPRAVSLVRSPRPPPTLELDTVLEERSDPEQTTVSQVSSYIYHSILHSINLILNYFYIELPFF